MMQRTTRFLARGAIIVALLVSTPVFAQDAPVRCPNESLATIYENADGSEDTFCFDPAEGVYQEVVVEEHIITIRTLSGESPGRVRVKLAGFLFDEGDGYELVKEHTEPRDGIYADADLGESFGLAELD